MIETVKLVIFIFFFAFVTSTSPAGALAFEHVSIAVEPTEGIDHVTTAFAFRNESQNPVRIRHVEASCGCTTAIASRTLIQPGASGTINATIAIAETLGVGIREIRVETDEKANNSYSLRLVTNNPDLGVVSTDKLMWPLASLPRPKSLEVNLRAGTGARIISAISSSTLFSIRVAESAAESTKRIVTVTPVETTMPSNAILVVTLMSNAGDIAVRDIQLTILPDAETANPLDTHPSHRVSTSG